MNELFIVLFGLTVVMLAERFPIFRHEPLAWRRRFFASDLVYLATGALGLSVAMRSGATYLRGDLASVGDGVSLWLAVPFTLLVFDFGAFVSHVLLHRIEALWPFHKVHHSSLKLDWLAGFRAHVVEHALRHLLSPVLLILIGFPLPAVGIAAVISGIWAGLAHANLRLRWPRLRLLFMAPELHRLHHGAASSDRNFGAVFSIWDRLFGSFLSDRDVATEPLGVPGEIDSYPQTWGAQFVEPWRGSLAQPEPLKPAA